MNNKIVVLILFSLFLASSCSEMEAISPGSLAPDFRLKAVDNSRFYLNGHRNKVVLLSFWAPWCKVCKNELIHMEGLYREYRKKGFIAVGINIEGADVDGAGNVVREYDITYPIVSDRKGEVKGLYKVKGIPHTFIIDRKGRVRFVHYGFSEKETRIYKEEIEQLLKET